MALDLAYFVDDVDMAIPCSRWYTVHPPRKTEACWRNFYAGDLREMILSGQIEDSNLASQHGRVSRSPKMESVGLSN